MPRTRKCPKNFYVNEVPRHDRLRVSSKRTNLLEKPLSRVQIKTKIVRVKLRCIKSKNTLEMVYDSDTVRFPPPHRTSNQYLFKTGGPSGFLGRRRLSRETAESTRSENRFGVHAIGSRKTFHHKHRS